MPVHREKEHSIPKPKTNSSSKTTRRSESEDRRPIITQEKPETSKYSNQVKGKIRTEKSPIDVLRRRKTDTPGEDIKSAKHTTSMKVKRNESIADKARKDTKTLMKDILDNKGFKKSEMEKSVKGKMKEKPFIEKQKEAEERKPKSKRDRTRTRTLSPTEVKQLLPDRIMYEMNKGTRVEATTAKEEKENTEETMEEGEENYEDDFEDYASDFEEDNEPESPTDLNPLPLSVNSLENQARKIREIAEQWKENIRKKEIETVRKSIQKENYNLERRTSITKPLDIETNQENFSTNEEVFIDFSSASKKHKISKKAAAKRKRGEELLNMITLDSISYNILEIPPIPYDDYMKIFGKSNTKQVHVQTNEDDLDEEVQTDEISLTNKWTQNPAEYLGSQKQRNKTFVLTREERLGVGGDTPEQEDIKIRTQSKVLWNFISWASQLMLAALERKGGNFLSLETLPNHSKAMAFGDGFLNLNVNDIPFLKGRSVTNLSLLSKNTGKMLSVHVNAEKSFQKCIICIWSLRELSKPLRVLLASNKVTSCCYSEGNLVFAGLSDGSICLWHLLESSAFHHRMINCPEWSLQSPTYTTAGNLNESEHSDSVVAVKVLNKTEDYKEFKEFTPMQICSLDKKGTIVIWTVVHLERSKRTAPSEDLGLAHWGRVKLVKSSSFCVFDNLRNEIPGLYISFNDVLINETEGDGFYVANSLGSVLHCSSYGTPMKPKFYVPSKQDAIVEATCLELCPFNGNYFLVGCGDGTIRLHSRHHGNPLICLNPNVDGDEKEAPIISISWMQMRPCVFFALDSISRINIWDLGISDMYPEISITLTEKKITSMKLSSVSDPRQVPFIVLGTAGGTIEIHKLKKEYGCRTANDVKNEMKMFLKYVSIL